MAFEYGGVSTVDRAKMLGIPRLHPYSHPQLTSEAPCATAPSCGCPFRLRIHVSQPRRSLPHTNSFSTCQVDIEDLSSEAKKVDYIHTKVKYLQLGLRSLKYTLKAASKDEAVKLDADEALFCHTLFRNRTEQRIAQDLRRQQAQSPTVPQA